MIRMVANQMPAITEGVDKTGAMEISEGVVMVNRQMAVQSTRIWRQRQALESCMLWVG